MRYVLLPRYIKVPRPKDVKKAFSSLNDMRELWKANNVTWRQMVAVLNGREIWLRILTNFRELEGSWPRALMKIGKIFQGKPVKRREGP
jgi:hypothetical protein